MDFNLKKENRDILFTSFTIQSIWNCNTNSVQLVPWFFRKSMQTCLFIQIPPARFIFSTIINWIFEERKLNVRTNIYNRCVLCTRIYGPHCAFSCLRTIEMLKIFPGCYILLIILFIYNSQHFNINDKSLCVWKTIYQLIC